MFLAHVWACAPFLVFWMLDMHIRAVIGPEAVAILRPVIGLTLVYLAVRTVIAWRDPDWLPWQYVFPPVDVALVSAILFLSHRGPMSNITLLFFLPMIQASGSLNVRWAAAVGFMVVIGTAVSTFGANEIVPADLPRSTRELLQQDPLNVTFRIYFLIVLSSLMAYQSLIAAGLKEKLGVAADRNRIAMDMHDGVQGHLIALSSQLELMARVAPKDGVRAAELAEEGRESARQAADELRFLVQRLRAPALEDGFVPALRQYAHNLCERHGLRLDFQVVGKEVPLEPEVENALFRIAQESITNVVKHAGAAQVTVSVAFQGMSAELVVQDDGQGFGVVREGVGLIGIRERAARAGGAAEVTSSPGGGTRVKASFT
ncbi:Sensor histidine kinase [Fimbriimonas ginsengisoli Gsoil 348]|uniref:histidine kinase n=1 Tax=Fimbriimonas ginsengisoli Gsoil 348 TaxID=661478 RepID=A0A068NY28_FIMGI|nr:Sensor histidine kinase [Fimbriimonas ginsengisoli Gsoil 348]